MGPLLFLTFINDLPSVLDPSTRCRLFADDCLVYREVNTQEDQIILLRDLYSLQRWAVQWGMLFNARKCNIMAVSRGGYKHNPYHLGGVALEWVDTCTYMGVTLSRDMKLGHPCYDMCQESEFSSWLPEKELEGKPTGAQACCIYFAGKVADGI